MKRILVIILSLLCSTALAQSPSLKKFQDYVVGLPPATAPASNSDSTVIVQGGNARNLTLGALLSVLPSITTITVPNALTVKGTFYQGDNDGGQTYAYLGQSNMANTLPNPNLGNGLAVGWNFTAGNGEVDFWHLWPNQNYSRTQAYNWYNVSGSTATLLMSLGDSGTLSLAPLTTTTNLQIQGLNIQQNGMAGGSYTDNGGSLFLNEIDVNSDNTAGIYGTALRILYLFGGANMTGAREGLHSEAVFNTPSSVSNTNRNYVGINGTVKCNSGDGGTTPTLAGGKGGCFGSNINTLAQLSATTQNLLDFVGTEYDIDLDPTNSSALVSALSLVKGTGVSGGTGGHGVQLDSAIRIGGKDWNQTLVWSDANGGTPVNTNSVLMQVINFQPTTPWTVTRGIDFRKFSFSDSAFLSNNFQVTGAGVVSGASFTVAGTAGVTCSGITTTTTIVTGGVITHC